jgi:hypothetical protein
MDFLIEKFKMQLDDLWTEEVRDAKVEGTSYEFYIFRPT